MENPQFEYLPTISAEKRASFNTIFSGIDDKRFLVYDIVRAIIEDAISDHACGFGRVVEISFDKKAISIRNYGRGIPSSRVVAVMLNARRDDLRTRTYQFEFDFPYITATSSVLFVASFRENKCSYAHFKGGELVDFGDKETSESEGLLIKVEPDVSLYGDYSFERETLHAIVTNYSYLYPRMVFHLNGEEIQSDNGLVDLVSRNVAENALYEPIELINHNYIANDLSVVICHKEAIGDKIFGFANNRYTLEGGTHVDAVRKAISCFFEIEFQGKFSNSDSHLVCAIAICVSPSRFSDETKTKLISTNMWEKYNWNTKQTESGPPIDLFINDYVFKGLTTFFDSHPGVKQSIMKQLENGEL